MENFYLSVIIYTIFITTLKKNLSVMDPFFKCYNCRPNLDLDRFLITKKLLHK